MNKCKFIVMSSEIMNLIYKKKTYCLYDVHINNKIEND